MSKNIIVMLWAMLLVTLLSVGIVSAAHAHDVSWIGIGQQISQISQDWYYAVAAISPLLSEYLTEHDCAAELGKTRRTLQRWREQRKGPAYTLVGNTVMYRRDGVRDWLRAQEQPLVREAQRAAKAGGRHEHGKKPTWRDRRRRREAQTAVA